MALLTLLAVVTIAIVRQRSLFGVVILSSIYSFLIASVMIVLDAVDVAMTEASVGAGISTVILLATQHDPAVSFGRDRRGAGLGDARFAAVRHRRQSDP
jgi:uncharacterized MnhB-related membrane protein